MFIFFVFYHATGLDSFTAQNIISTILRLAKNGRSIVATIHQPRSSISMVCVIFIILLIPLLFF